MARRRRSRIVRTFSNSLGEGKLTIAIAVAALAAIAPLTTAVSGHYTNQRSLALKGLELDQRLALEYLKIIKEKNLDRTEREGVLVFMSRAAYSDEARMWASQELKRERQQIQEIQQELEAEKLKLSRMRASLATLLNSAADQSARLANVSSDDPADEALVAQLREEIRNRDLEIRQSLEELEEKRVEIATLQQRLADTKPKSRSTANNPSVTTGPSADTQNEDPVILSATIEPLWDPDSGYQPPIPAYEFVKAGTVVTIRGRNFGSGGYVVPGNPNRGFSGEPLSVRLWQENRIVAVFRETSLTASYRGNLYISTDDYRVSNQAEIRFADGPEMP